MNKQWQHKQQITDNQQKSKIHKRTRTTTMELIKKRISNRNIGNNRQ